jgi:UDP-N-acetylglucosamine 2-epimerase
MAFDTVLRFRSVGDCMMTSDSRGNHVAPQRHRKTPRATTPRILQWVHGLAKAPLTEGKTLLELTAFNGASLWWLVYLSFYNAVILYSQSAKDKGTRITHRPLSVVLRDSLRPLELLYSLSMMIVSRINTRLYPKGANAGRPKILITALNIDWRRPSLPTQNSSRKIDVFFEPIIRELKRKGMYDLRSTYPLRNPLSGISVMIDKRLHQPDLVHVPFDAYWSASVSRAEAVLRRRFTRIWNDLRKDPSFKTLLSYRGAGLLEAMETVIRDLFVFRLARGAANVMMAEEMIKRENPQLIILQDEYSEWERCLAVAARKMGVPTLAIQHGVIGPGHFGYYHPKEKTYDKPGAFPIPTLTAVYGEYTRKMLEQTCNYPPGSVVAVGNHRFDYIPSYLSDTSTKTWEAVCEEFGLDPQKRIVLVATGALQSKYGYPDHDRMLLDAVYSARLSRPELQLVVKLHPKEDGALQRVMAAEMGLDDVVIVKERLVELLRICDLLVTMHSTVAMEAIAIGKPVVTVNLTGEKDPYPYAESGAAIGVYRREDLLPAVYAALEDPKIRRRLDEGRRRFVRDHLHGADGRASERIAQLATRLMDEKKGVASRCTSGAPCHHRPERRGRQLAFLLLWLRAYDLPLRLPRLSRTRREFLVSVSPRGGQEASASHSRRSVRSKPSAAKPSSGVLSCSECSLGTCMVCPPNVNAGVLTLSRSLREKSFIRTQHQRPCITNAQESDKGAA